MEFDYLVKRAELFFEFLDKNNIDKVFPFREESKKELASKIASGNLQKLRNYNKLIDNLITGKNNFLPEQQLNILNYFEEKLGENKSSFIEQKLKIYNSIIKKDYIKSRNEINDAIEISNSNILGLSEVEKNNLREIITKSMLGRI